MSDNDFSKGLFAGIISGAMIGSVFALLFAPDKGINTRDKLSYRLSLYLDELNQLQEKIRHQKQELVSEAKEQSDQIVLNAQKKAEDLIKEAEDLISSINQAKEQV